MNDVMVDLETMGTVAGCAILSIGAVGFDENGLGSEFYRVVYIRSCLDAGLFIDPETLEWWKSQSEEARKILTLVKSLETSIPLKQALEEFNEFLTTYGDKVVLWGNGAVMDNAILLAAARAVDLKLPVKYWNHLCYRTIKETNPDVKFKRVGTHHNALDDAKSQALHFVEIMNN